MRATTMIRMLLLAGLAAGATAARADAQTLAQRVRSTRDGAVTLHFAARPGACGDGRHFFSLGGRTVFGQWSSGSDAVEWRLRCAPGPARVRMRMEHGTITALRVDVGPNVASTDSATDLGRVSSAEAAGFFLALVDRAASSVSRDAITAAVLADSASVWRRLLAIATDTERVTRSTRRHALFWVGRFVAAKATGHGEDLAAAEDADDRAEDREDTREAAVFALSQLRGKRGIDALLDVARSNKDPVVRQKAIFWLGESGDPRAVALFKEILAG